MAVDEIDGAQTNQSGSDSADEKPEDMKERLKGALRVDVADAGVLRKAVSIGVPRKCIDEELEKEYREIVAEAIVPGFRRGRAPRRLIEKRFGQEVGSQVQTRLVSNAYLAAIEKVDIKVLGDPLVWVRPRKKGDGEGGAEELLDMSVALQHMKLPDEGDFEFKCEVEVKPEFELPALEGVEIERPILNIDDDDVSVQIDRIRARRGNWAPVAGGSVQADDLLIGDLVLTVGGEEVKRMENFALSARAQRIEGMTLSDLGEKFEGAKVGDRREFEGELPDDYAVEVHRGKRAKLAFTLNDIKRMNLPPLDDSFLQTLGFDSEKELREGIRTRMEGELEHHVRRGMRNLVRKYLLDQTHLDLPEGISTRQTERAVLRKAIELQQEGVPQAEIDKHMDELRTSAREQSAAELKLHFILEAIAEKLDVGVKEEEINREIASMAAANNRRFDRVRDDLARNDGISMLYLQIRDDKCIDRILEKAKIVELAEPKKNPGAAKKAPEEKPGSGKSAAPAARAKAKAPFGAKGGESKKSAAGKKAGKKAP
jgi:trigger factor